MPSSENQPSRVPMWKGVKFAYLLIAFCLFPLAIVGHWAYDYMLPFDSGMLTALYNYHSRNMSPSVIGTISFFIIVSAVSSFPIYAMPVFDLMESSYTTRTNKPCQWWLRAVFRAAFGFLCFFVAVAIPSFWTLDTLLLGAMVLPVTLAYPCFMWIKIKKPKMCSPMWWINWGLGILGMALSVVLVVLGVYFVVFGDFRVDFFNPE